MTLGVPGALFGDPDTAASFDGVNDLVRVPDAGGLDVGDSFTLEGWIKRSSESRTHQMFLKGGRSFQLTVMNAANGNQVWLRKAGVSTVAHSEVGVPADEEYHHVVATKDGPNSARIYIDGVESTETVRVPRSWAIRPTRCSSPAATRRPTISMSSRSMAARWTPTRFSSTRRAATRPPSQ
ncbi:MAG: LamG-like jellyroll fold domain-containing protein [Egibacteraceae bacterium]